MKAGLSTVVLCAMVLGCFVSCTADAELTLSITITGSPDELLPVLKRLKKLGIGVEKKEKTTEEPLRVEMHSVSSEHDASGVDQASGPKTAELGLWGAAVQPSPAEAGGMVMVTVQIADSEGRIDTVAAIMDGADGYIFDLYDNGRYGDEAAGDGVWSYQLTVPQSLDAEQYTILIIPYDRRGDEIVVEGADGEMVPLRSEVVLPIER